MSEAVSQTRAQRKILVGEVTSAKAPKTLTVRVDRLVKHPIVEKFQRKSTVIYVHDEKGEAQERDQVEVVETRPLSKNKRWRLLKVLRRASS